MTINFNADVIFGFSELYLKRNFDEPEETPAVHFEWWRLFCLPKKNVAIAAPRNHAKSTALTHSFVLASVCLRVRKHVLIVSDTEGQAIQFLGDVARELAENENLQKDFHIKANFVTDTKTEIIIEFEDGGQARLVAKGSGQKLRGMKWRNTRPDLIMCDDIENDEHVLNDDTRLQHRKWFQQALMPCGSKNCIVRMVGTILHEDSLLNRLMPKEDEKGTIIEPLRMYSANQKKAWKAVLYRAHPDFNDFSEILWPEMWPEERLREEQARCVEDGQPESYYQEYLNKVQLGDQAFFKRPDLLPIPDEEKDAATRENELFYIGVDLAISTADRRAYSVFVVAGLSPTGVLRIRDVVRDRMDGLQIIETMFTLHARWGNVQGDPVFFMEDENIRKAIGSFLEEEMTLREIYLSLELFPAMRDKQTRARSIQARIRSHTVQFDDQAVWWPIFLRELTLFPRGEFVDQVDALAWIGQGLSKMNTTPTDSEIEEEDYWDSVTEGGYEDYEMNSTTGY